MIGITWKDCYATNVGCFDEEHKKLVNLIDQYFKALREKQGAKVVKDILAQLLDYTETHFAHEEKLMKEYAYPRYQACQEHRKMVATVKGFQLMLSEPDQDCDEVLLTVRNFLRDWLLNHIVEEDQKYGPFFNDRGIA
jgi:hemerythrin-like metal-binding protein